MATLTGMNKDKTLDSNIKIKNIKEFVVKNSPYLAVAIIVVFIRKWYFYNLGAVQLWNDEYSHVFAAKSIIANGKPLMLSGKPYTRALVYTYMVAVSYKFFGVSEYASRLPSIFIGFLILTASFFTLKKVTNSIIPAIILMGVLAFDPSMYWWSRTSRMYILQALIFFFCFLAYYFAVEELFNKKPKIKVIGNFTAFMILFIASYNIQQLTLLFIPVMIIYPIVHPKSKFDKKKLGVYGIALAACLAVYFILRFTFPQFNVINTGKFVLGKFLPPKFRMNWASEEGYYFNYFLTNYMFVIPFFVYGVYTSFKEKNNFLILCSVASVTIITILSTVFAILVDSRFVLFVLPFVYMLIAFGAFSLFKKFTESLKLNQLALSLLIVVLFALAILAGRANLQHLQAFDFFGPVDFRGMSQLVANHPYYKKNQIVISTVPLATIYYMNDTDYWIRQVVDKRFIINKNGKRLEYYSGVPILDNPKTLSKLLEKERVWLIVDLKRYKSYLKDNMKSVIDDEMEPVAQLNGVKLYVNNRYAVKTLIEANKLKNNEQSEKLLFRKIKFF